MTEWREVKLGDVADVIGGGTPKTSIKEYWDGNIPWLSVKDFNNDQRYVYKTEKTITEKGLEKSSTNILQNGDIIISARGTVGELAIIPFEMAFNQSCYGIRTKKVLDNEFLYYFLKNSINFLKKNTHGSVFDTITKDTLSSLVIYLPPLDIQKKIAGVLGALDDKIELNNKINQNLEAQAQALFKSWFIDFEPFGGKMPNDWKECCLGDICECLLGGTPNRNIPEYWNGDIPWINSGEVNNFRIVKPSEYISKLGLSKSATKLLPEKTTVIAITGATLGQVSLLEIKACANQSVVGILQNSDMPYEFIFPFIKYNILDLISHQTGGAQQHINKQNVEHMYVLKPAKDVLLKYKKTLEPLYKMIAKNCFENIRFAELRDTLLPKLMNGEIDVDNVKID